MDEEGGGGGGGEGYGLMANVETRPDTRPQVANLGLRSLIVTDGRTHGQTNDAPNLILDDSVATATRHLAVEAMTEDMA